MSARTVLPAMIVKELRSLIRDRQQAFALFIMVVSMIFVIQAVEAPLRRFEKHSELRREADALVHKVAQGAANPEESAKLEALRPKPAKLPSPAAIRWAILGIAAGLAFYGSMFAITLALTSFVGEKEEGTLEVLLAAPLPDATLYLYKFLAVLIPSCVAAYAVPTISGVYLLFSHRETVAALPDGQVALAVALALPVPLLFTAIQVAVGACISSLANTTKGAGQLWGAILFGLLFGGGLIVSLLLSSPMGEPLTRAGLWWTRQDFAYQYASLLGLAVCVCALFLALGALGFRRERLVK